MLDWWEWGRSFGFITDSDNDFYSSYVTLPMFADSKFVKKVSYGILGL